ncbi:MAG: potassium channel family protein [Acidobacteriota bacterium]
MEQLHKILSTDAGLTILLASLSTVLFVIYPFVPLSPTGRLVVSASLTIVLVSGAFTLSDRPRLKRFVVGLGGLGLLTQWLSNATHQPGILIASYATTLCFLALTAAGVLAKAMRPGRITSHRIQGAIAVFLLLGLIWGYGYALIELVHPGSFHLPEDAPSSSVPPRGDERIGDLVYFSFVTLTTLGYGDITPISSTSRTLALLEALVGQLYLVILIARLVSLQIADADAGTET